MPWADMPRLWGSVVLVWLLTNGVGCRSRAFNDVYAQRMASEIRVLEDQLYEADYENRILHEKLVRAEEKIDRLAIEKPAGEASAGRRQRLPAPTPVPDPRSDSYSPDNFDLGDDPDGTLPAPRSSGGARIEEDADAKPSPGSISPPATPFPPGMDDLELPQIDPGELAPPPAASEPPDAPPGQILLPDAVRAASPGGAKVGTPTTISLHPALSSGHVFDDGTEGLMLTVNVLDEQKRPLDLEAYEIAAPMTIVAVDPNRQVDLGRIARWEINAEEVARRVRHEPVSGLQIPLRWQGERPSGESVEIHVRLKTDDEEMRCQASVPVSPPATTAEWMPRSGSNRRE